MACKYCLTTSSSYIRTGSETAAIAVAGSQIKVFEQLALALAEIQKTPIELNLVETAAFINLAGQKGIKTLLLNLTQKISVGVNPNLSWLLTLGEKECLPLLVTMLQTLDDQKRILALLTLQKILPAAEFQKTLEDFLLVNDQLSLDFIDRLLEDVYPDDISAKGLNLLLTKILKINPANNQSHTFFSALGLIIEIANQKLYYLELPLLQKVAKLYEDDEYESEGVQRCLALWKLKNQIQQKQEFSLAEIDSRNCHLFLAEQQVTYAQLSDENLKIIFKLLRERWSPTLNSYLPCLKKDLSRLERLLEEVFAEDPHYFLTYTNYFDLLKLLPPAKALYFITQFNRSAAADQAVLFFWASYFHYQNLETATGQKYFQQGLKSLAQDVSYPLNKEVAKTVEISPYFADFSDWLTKMLQKEDSCFEGIWEITCNNQQIAAFQNLSSFFWRKLYKGYQSYLTQLPHSEEQWEFFWQSLTEFQKETSQKTNKRGYSLPLSTKFLLWLGDREERVETLAQIPPKQLAKIQTYFEEALLASPNVFANFNKNQLLHYLLTPKAFRLLKEQKIFSESELLIALAKQQHFKRNNQLSK